MPLTLSGDAGAVQDAVRRVGGSRRQRRQGAASAKRRCSPIAACPGPAILQVSSYWRHGEHGDGRLPARPARAAGFGRPSATIRAPRLRRLLGRSLPDRLAETLADQLGLTGDLGNMPDRSLDAAERRLADWQFTPNGSEGFAKAEVTIGGISTAELSSQTMESKRVPGLFAIGEAVDVTGWLGGYNFQWAWASAHAAAQAL